AKDPAHIRIEQGRAELEKDDQEGQPQSVDIGPDVAARVRLDDPALHELVVAREQFRAPLVAVEKRPAKILSGRTPFLAVARVPIVDPGRKGFDVLQSARYIVRQRF